MSTYNVGERQMALNELRDLIEIAVGVTDNSCSTSEPMALVDLNHLQTLLSVAQERARAEIGHIEANYKALRSLAADGGRRAS